MQGACRRLSFGYYSQKSAYGRFDQSSQVLDQRQAPAVGGDRGARAGILQATQPLGCQYKELAQKDMVEDVDDEDEEVFEPPEKVIVCGNNFSRHFDLEAIPIIYLGTS